MPEPEPFLLFIRPLNRAGFRYIVTGSIAATFYGEPRLTHDVDVVIYLNVEDVRRLSEVFPVTKYYVPPIETLLAEVSRVRPSSFNIIHMDSGFKADMYPTGRDEFNAWAFRRKRAVQFDSETVFLAPPEYVIVRKLEFYREGGSEKHLRDIRGMLAVSGDQIDRSELSAWIQRQGVQQEWQKVES